MWLRADFLNDPVGVLAGAILIVDSANTITREVGRQFLNEPDTQGMFGDGAMNISKFMGFERSTGLGIYNGIALAGNIYSVYGLMARPGTWRLFKVPIFTGKSTPCPGVN
ncbi:DUF4225 domain-containing protein [Enterobacter chuandaensis]|uniref:DUF4225 domain-containing protein n=1 Tax=Enterobacter chuandaensis TaxID=2497875 RepID=UPI00300D5A7A